MRGGKSTVLCKLFDRLEREEGFTPVFTNDRRTFCCGHSGVTSWGCLTKTRWIIDVSLLWCGSRNRLDIRKRELGVRVTKAGAAVRREELRIAFAEHALRSMHVQGSQRRANCSWRATSRLG
eukprot:TRINITY_DN5295_c2_g2_i1.p3 TRINITY_DN5295_c2_g2~~TRINITY_DN5295_c2_g2_i1.p3  ORF type:complete len:122 (+),score=12.61 TRINITY_DN5295_c2_g2_i1:28-393(+)